MTNPLSTPLSSSPSIVLGRDYSLEITAKDTAALSDSRSAIPVGTQVAITFLPGETWEARVAAAVAVRQLGFIPVPHIAARLVGSEQELDRFLHTLSDEATIDRVFVIAGDVPAAQGPYTDALAVINSGLLVRHGVKQVGISGYPDGHPSISDASLWQALHDKRNALHRDGQELEIVTQFGFDADPFVTWIQKVRSEGIDDPIRIGIPGPAGVKSLLRFAARCGVGTSAKVLSKYGLSLTKLIGSVGPDRLLADLRRELAKAHHGSVRLHLYPFGGIDRAVSYIQTIESSFVDGVEA
jgi:methylenetetrahydrofolate reductase (NADPH)